MYRSAQQQIKIRLIVLFFSCVKVFNRLLIINLKGIRLEGHTSKWHAKCDWDKFRVYQNLDNQKTRQAVPPGCKEIMDDFRTDAGLQKKSPGLPPPT
jgi:hypothetical protein